MQRRSYRLEPDSSVRDPLRFVLETEGYSAEEPLGAAIEQSHPANR